MTIEITRLRPGLTVATAALPDRFLSVSLGAVMRNAASRHETKELNGISHLLEHMLFKGTETRSAAEIATTIEEIGGEINAFTSHESTDVRLSVLGDDLPRAIEILGDMLRRPRLSDEDLELERQVVLQEIAEREDDPQALVFEKLYSAAYGDTHAMGRPIAGTVGTVSALNAAQLRAWRDYNYGDILVVAAGGVDNDLLLSLLDDHLAGETSEREPPDDMDPPYLGGTILTNRPIEACHMAIGFRGLGRKDELSHAANCASILLGEGMSSILFQSLREERGLCYAINSFRIGLPEHGLFGVYLATHPSNSELAYELVNNHLLRLVRDGVPGDLLEKAKKILSVRYLMEAEHCSGVQQRLEVDLCTFGKPIDLEQRLREISMVSPKQVKTVLAMMLAQPTSFAAVGDTNFGFLP